MLMTLCWCVVYIILKKMEKYFQLVTNERKQEVQVQVSLTS